MRRASSGLVWKVTLAGIWAAVREEHADLAVFDASGATAILRLHASRVAAAFRKATFIDDQHREGGRRLSRLNCERGRRGEGLAEEGTQLIAHPVVIPDSA
jgi:hypothetical protein